MTAYELYYWPEIQGRGELVRLALEEAGAAYVDVARMRGSDAIARALAGKLGGARPFAPPILRAGKTVVAQTACILHFLGPRLGLVPKSEALRLAALQYQLTITDFLAEVHDTHHPIDTGSYYEDQVREAKARAKAFRTGRLRKFLRFFEALVPKSGYVFGQKVSYVDLSLFQVVEGLEYAFPRAFARAGRAAPRLRALRDRVQERPRIAAYLASPRRIPFNEMGIFRRYPALDG
jgi:glutathione S-transferase